MNCKDFQSELPQLLLDATPLDPATATHVEECANCREEYDSYKATFRLLDTWHAPEPSSYFDQKLAVRLREAQAEPTMSWFERLQAQFMFNTGRQFRPVLTGAFAVLLLAGGGTAAKLSTLMHPRAVEASATVNDLQILDRNEQAFQQMDQLLQDEENTTPDSAGQSVPPLS